MDQDRILAKIKKCMEMAKSKTANPNEAEIALRQAHKLMEAYNLELGDVLASMAGEVQIAAGSEGQPPTWRCRLAQVCAHAFGTRMIITTDWLIGGGFIFVGCAAAPALTGYAYEVLERQLQKARREFLAPMKRCKRSTKVARGDHFANGWIDAVYHKVDEFAGVEDNIAKGFKVRPNTKAKRPLADDEQSKKIRALWLTLHDMGAVRDPSEEALAKYVLRMTKVAALQWLTAAQASQVIENLKQWMGRVQQ